MLQRRDLLKTSLTICGCAACGELGIGASDSAARPADSAAIRGAGYDLWFTGAQRETIMNGKLAAELDLKTLAKRPHLYCVGPIEQLRGEITIVDSRPALARVGPYGAVEVTQSFDVGAPFLVWAEVPRWVERPIRPKSAATKTSSALFRKPLRPPASMPSCRCRSWSPAGRI
jgi:hypothetical protein